MKRINLEGEFGWDIYSSKIREQLDEAKGEDLDVHIASPGGSVFEGIKVFNDFRDYKRRYPESQNMLTVKGLAASMASYFSMNPAFELVVVEDNAVLMIHNPTGGVVGDYRDASKFADMLKGLTDLLIQAYCKKTKKTKSQIAALMDDETWYFGSEIIENGFADEIIESEEEKDKSVAIADAQLQFGETRHRINTTQIENEELLKIAAALDVEKKAVVEDKKEHDPAKETRDNNINQEVNSMTLKEFLDQNPAAKIEYDETIKNATDAGRQEIRDVISKAAPFLSNAEYPKQIHESAVAVIKGEKSADILDSMVATADMIKEMQKSNDANDEQKSDIKGQDLNSGLSEEYQKDGTIMNQADMEAELNRVGVN